MGLSSDVIDAFVEVTKDNTEVKDESTVLGTVVKYNNKDYVKLDGSDLLTPIISTTVVQNGEKVMVLIKDHTATITGNISSPSASDKDLQDTKQDIVQIGNKISEFEIVIADKVSVQEFDAVKGRIDNLTAENVTIKNQLTAAEGNISILQSDNVTINNKLTAHDANIQNLQTSKLDASVADITYATIANLEATDAKINNLESTYGEFKVLATNKFTAIEADIDNLEANKITTEFLDANYAKVDLANIEDGCITTAMIGTGVVGTAQIADGSITDAKIVGLTANKITAGILDAATIEVVNLNAANITVGTINGQQIAPGAIDLSNLSSGVQGSINTANSNANQAIQDALNAMNKATSAENAANTAQTTANGKNTVFYQTSSPSTSGRKTNDIWFDTDDGNKMYYWNGSAWTVRQFGTNAIANLSITNALIADGTIQNGKIANLDAGKITTGTLNAARIGANSIAIGKLDTLTQNAINNADKQFKQWVDLSSSIYDTEKYYPVVTDSSIPNDAIYNKYTCNVMLNSGTKPSWSTHNGGFTCNLLAWIKHPGWGATNGPYGWIEHNDYKFCDKMPVFITTLTNTSRVVFYLRGGGKYRISCPNSTTVTVYTTKTNTCTDSYPEYVEPKTSPSNGLIVMEPRIIGAWCYEADTTYINGGKIYTGTITASQIAASTITGSKIAAGTITAGNIASSAITTDKLAASAVTAAKIAAGTITGDKLVASTITGDKIAASTITANNIAANTITAAKIASGTITATQLAANSVTADKINVGAVTAAKIASSAITSDKIAANAITTEKLATNAIKSLNYVAGSAGSYLNLADGSFDSKYLKWTNTGVLTATSGTIGGITIEANSLSASSSDIDDDGTSTYTFGYIIENSGRIHLYENHAMAGEREYDVYLEGVGLTIHGQNTTGTSKIVTRLIDNMLSFDYQTTGDGWGYISLDGADGVLVIYGEYGVRIRSNLIMSDSKQILRNGEGASWISGRDKAMIRQKTISAYSPAMSIKTTNGSWEIGAYDNSSFTDRLIFTYISDSNYNANNNNVSSRIQFLSDGSIIANNIFRQYSTSEQWTGKYWIDGKKIYQKTYQIGAMSGQATWSTSLSGIDNIWYDMANSFYVEGSGSGSAGNAGNVWPLNGNFGTSADVSYIVNGRGPYYLPSNKTLNWRVPKSGCSKAYITVYYTK